jgi:ABC-type cobalamin/Fe3+-siderophores transport system ATPase subunit
MSKYATEMRRIEEAAKRIAKFYKVGFHCHSPLSHDWGKNKGDPILNGAEQYLPPDKESEFYHLIQKRSGCDMVIITDHMKCRYAERLAKYSSEQSGLVILPGMEISVRTSPVLGDVRVHVIVIMSPGANPETFAPLLKGISIENERTGKEEVKVNDFTAWVAEIHKLGGLCIAAHIESSSGVRSEFRQTAKNIIALQTFDPVTQQEKQGDIESSLTKFLFDFGFDAIEIQRKEHNEFYRWYESDGEKRNLATIMGYDAHCIEDYVKDHRTTMVKMTTPSIEGLRDALKFPETRIRFSDEIVTPPSPQVIGMSISGSQDSFFEDVTTAFSGNLNCIIGPRGSGKSTIVEVFRYVFGYNRTLKELDQANKLSERIKDLQQATLQGTLLKIYYKLSNGEIRVLEATYDAKQTYTTKVYDLDGNYISVEDIERAGEYPLRLYGWSEIETLGRDTPRQRSLLDRMIPNIAVALDSRQQILDELKDNRHGVVTSITKLNQILNKDDNLIYRYNEFKEDFDKINKDDVKENFDAIDFANLKKTIYEKLSANTTELKSDIEGIEPVNIRSGLEKILNEGGDEIQKWWLAEQLDDKRVVQVEQYASSTIKEVIGKLEELESMLAQKDTLLDTEINNLYSDLREQFSDKPDQQKIADLRSNAKNRLASVTALRESYLETWIKFKQLITTRGNILKKMNEVQNQITGIRANKIEEVKEKLNLFTNDKLKIDIHMIPSGDREEFRKEIPKFLRARSIRAEQKLTDVISSHFTPLEFCQFILRGKIEEMQSAATDLTNNNIIKLKENCRIHEKHEGADVKVLLESGKVLLDVLGLQEIVWDDSESILLNNKPVNKLSPGQRSSAMLPLIALAEKSPLIIDQPEDNLDNRLVGDVLVDILAELKESRQIIVCTHNPNIVVSGDAEQVIVLDSESNDKGQLQLSGSIDNNDIVKTVIDIMEGGKEAFKARKRRYKM